MIELNREMVSGPSKVAVFNTAGQEIISRDIQGSGVLNISELVFIRISGRRGESIRKIILQ